MHATQHFGLLLNAYQAAAAAAHAAADALVRPCRRGSFNNPPHLQKAPAKMSMHLLVLARKTSNVKEFARAAPASQQHVEGRKNTEYSLQV